VVLITLDTLRYDALWGSPGRESAMPRTLARAREGLSFRSFFSSTSSTQPTHASLFTSLHPWEHGVSRNGLTLADEHTTVAETLRAAGFATAAVVGSFPVASRFGFGQGFDAYDEEMSEGQMAPGWEGLADVESSYYRRASVISDRAIAALDRSRGGPEFYWFHYFDAHAPYGDSADGPRLRPHDLLNLSRSGVDVRAEVARARDLYDRDVRSMDEALERVFVRLERDRGRYETHVVVTADHGESFGEDGSLAHGRRVTPGQIHVPFFILSPRVRGAERGDPAGSIDVPLTLYALAGVTATAPGGRDLLSSSRRAGAFGMRRSFGSRQTEWRLDGRTYGLDFNLFYAVGRDGHIRAGNGKQLMPEEGTGEGGAVAGLQALFARFEEQLKGSERPRETDPDVERALKALGYVG
jgi:arylsulfatase A-like enzyme